MVEWLEIGLCAGGTVAIIAAVVGISFEGEGDSVSS